MRTSPDHILRSHFGTLPRLDPPQSEIAAYYQAQSAHDGMREPDPT